MKKCPACGKIYYGDDYYCLKDNQRLVECEDKYYVPKVPDAEQECNIPKCPTCQSTRIKKISTLNRSISVLALGLLSSKIGKQFQCENCGYKW